MTKKLVERVAKAMHNTLKKPWQLPWDKISKDGDRAQHYLVLADIAVRAFRRGEKRSRDTKPKRVSYLRVNGAPTGYGGRGWTCVRAAESKRAKKARGKR